MMSNYGRTTELVNAANNSAGASNQQFEKTLESLDAKLNQLKNAFNEFSMGIMNSDLLKKGVDALTQLFNIINKISTGFGSVTGSISKVGVVFSVIKLGEALIKKFLANINTGITSMGTNLGNSIAQGVTEGMNRAKGIVTDAVDEMNGKVQSSQPVGAPQKVGPVQQRLQQNTEGFKQVMAGLAQKATSKMPTQYNKISPVFGNEGLKKFAVDVNKSLKTSLGKAVDNVKFNQNKFQKNLFPESLWNKINKQFSDKMTAMGKSTEDISKAWTEVTGEASNTLDVIDGLDKKLEEAFNSDKNLVKDDAYKEIKADIEGLTDEEKNLGEVRMQIAERSMVAYDNLTQGMMKCGVAATAVGVAFGTIGAYLEGMGLEEAGQAFTDLGNILTVTGGTLSGFSGILSALKPIVAKLTVALGSTVLAAGAVTIAIIALVAIVGVLIWAFKNAQANSPEGKLKAAEEAAEKAGEAADRASEAYNNLKASLDSLDSGYEALEDLTYGTEEWKEQVEKLNKEVKTLVETYPELAKFVTMEDGVLTLDTDAEGVEEILADYRLGEMKAQAAEYGAQLNKATAQQRIYEDAMANSFGYTFEEFNDVNSSTGIGAGIGTSVGIVAAAIVDYFTAGVGAFTNAAIISAGTSIGAAIGGLFDATEEGKINIGKEQGVLVSKALAQGILIENEEGQVEITDQEAYDALGIKVSEEAINEFITVVEGGTRALKNFGEQLLQTEASQDLLYTQIGQEAYSQLDTSKFTQEEREMVSNFANNDIMIEQAYSKALEYWENLDKDSYKNLALQEAQQIFKGAEIKIDGDTIKYKYEGDQDFTEISRDAFEVQLAAADAAEEMTKAFKDLPKTVKTFSNSLKGPGNNFEKLFMGDKSLTNEDIHLFTTDFDAEYYWEKMDEEMQAFFDGDYTLWEEYFNGIVETSQKAIEDFNATMTDLEGGDYFKNKINAQTADRYNNFLEEILSTSGKASAQEVNNSLNDIFSKYKLNTEEIETFLSVISSKDFDIKNIENWEKLPTLLQEAGIKLPTEELKDLAKQSAIAAGAIKKIDLEKTTEQISNLSNILNKLNSGEQGRSFSEEDYNTLTSTGAVSQDEFTKSLDGSYVYLGNSMWELRKAIMLNTQALLKDTQTGFEGTFSAYDLINTYEEQYDVILKDYSGWDEVKQKNILMNYLTDFKKEGGDIPNLTEGLIGEKADLHQWIQNASQETLEEVYQAIINNSSDALTNSLNTYKQQILDNMTSLDVSESLLEGESSRTNLLSMLDEEDFDKKSSEFKLLLADIEAYMNTINNKAFSLGVDENTLGRYATLRNEFINLNNDLENNKISVDKYKEGIANLIPQISKYEKTMSSAMNTKKVKKSFSEIMTSMTSLAEEMEQILDPKLKTDLLSSAVEDFGINVHDMSEESKKELEGWVQAVVSGGEEGLSGLQSILALSATQMTEDWKDMNKDFKGAAIDISQISSMVFGAGLDENQELYQKFAQMLVDTGLATWEILDGQQKRIVWNMAQYYSDIQQLYGKKKDKDDKEEYWESDYSWLYNYNEEINQLIREREQSEKDYQKALKNSAATAEDLRRATKEHLEDLKGLSNAYVVGAEKALASIREMFADPKNSEFVQYVRFEPESGTITIDDAALAKIQVNATWGDNFKSFIAALENNREEVIKAKEALYDIEQDVEDLEDLQDQGREALADIYDDVKEGLVQQRREELDAIRENTEAINEAERALMESLQEQINEMREARDNAKTERDLDSKRAKLAYLKRDTSGMYGLDILSLEKEIAEQEEQYTDQLIDQKLQDLQEASDKAIEQRNKQIELQEKEFEEWSKSQAIWSEVESIVNEGLTNVDNWQSTTAGKLQGLNDNQVNPIRQAEQQEEENRKATLAASYKAGDLDFTNDKQAALVEIQENQDKIDDQTKALGTQGNIDIPTGLKAISDGVNLLNDYKSEDNAFDDQAEAIGGYIVEQTGALEKAIADAQKAMAEREAKQKAYQSEVSEKGSGVMWKTYKDVQAAGYENQVKSKEDFNKWTDSNPYRNYEEYLMAKFYELLGSYVTRKTSTSDGLKDYGFTETSKTPTSQAQPKAKGVLTQDIATTESLAKQNTVNIGTKKYFKVDKTYYDMEDVVKEQSNTGLIQYKWKRGTTYYQFEKGGLADFTGPAWLDGTKASPELILNAQDTRNFIMLKDVLSDILSGTSTIKHSSTEDGTKGDNYYEIEINVDSLSDDYDVDQLASKIKSMIYEDSIYRNVNTVNLLR